MATEWLVKFESTPVPRYLVYQKGQHWVLEFSEENEADAMAAASLLSRSGAKTSMVCGH